MMQTVKPTRKINKNKESITYQNVATFFKQRFNMQPEHDKHYFEEWLYRFTYCTRQQLHKIMDDESVQAWFDVTGIWIRVLPITRIFEELPHTTDFKLNFVLGYGALCGMIPTHSADWLTQIPTTCFGSYSGCEHASTCPYNTDAIPTADDLGKA